MARRATSLGPKPSFFCWCFLVLFLFFLSFLCFYKKLFPLQKGIFCLFLSVSLCFSLAFFFGLPLFQLLFLCLSLLFFFLSSFLSFFLLSFASLFLSLSFLFFLLCFCFMRRTTSKYSITKIFFINISRFWFSVLFSHWNLFFVSLFFFPWF